MNYMMNKNTVLLLLICLQAVWCSQYVPIPKRHPGVLVGSPAALVNVELIYDPQCDGSAELNGVIQQVSKQLGNLTDNKISFRYYFLSLPYHIYSTKLTQGYYYIRETKGDQAAYNFINYCMSNIEKWSETSTLNLTMNVFESQLTDDVVKFLQVDKSGFALSLRHGTQYDLLAREEFKHVTGSKATSGTPRVFINGALADGAESWSVQDWVSKLNGLL